MPSPLGLDTPDGRLVRCREILALLETLAGNAQRAGGVVSSDARPASAPFQGGSMKRRRSTVAGFRFAPTVIKAGAPPAATGALAARPRQQSVGGGSRRSLVHA